MWFTAPFNNVRTLKFNAQPTNAFFATVNQMFGGPSSSRLLFHCLKCAQRFDYRFLSVEKIVFVNLKKYFFPCKYNDKNKVENVWICS